MNRLASNVEIYLKAPHYCLIMTIQQNLSAMGLIFKKILPLQPLKKEKEQLKPENHVRNSRYSRATTQSI